MRDNSEADAIIQSVEWKQQAKQKIIKTKRTLKKRGKAMAAIIWNPS